MSLFFVFLGPGSELGIELAAVNVYELFFSSYFCFLQELSILLTAQVQNLRGILASSFYLIYHMASVTRSHVFCPRNIW